MFSHNVLILVASFSIATNDDQILLLVFGNACIEKLLKNSVIAFLESSASPSKNTFKTAKNCTENKPLQSFELIFWYSWTGDIMSFFFISWGISPGVTDIKFNLPRNLPKT